MPATDRDLAYDADREEGEAVLGAPWLGHTSVLLHLACCLVTPGGMLLPSQALHWVPP